MSEQQDQSPKRSAKHAFRRFTLVGAIGFFVDAGALLLVTSNGADLYSGRLFSFFCAVTATWYMNRRFTFASKDRRWFLEWARFVSANTVGGIINYLTYAALITWVPLFADYPVAAVGVGALFGLIWNFSLSHKLVFTTTRY